MDWSKAAKEILSAVAPVLGTAVGGPLGGVAARAIAGALLGDENAAPEAIEAAIVNASPADLVKLREIDKKFAVDMKKLDIDVLKIDAGDRDSARRREVESGDPWTPRVLGVLVVGSFLGYAAIVTFAGAPTDLALVNLVVGWMGGMASAVMTYYFGSSAGSKAKTDALNKLMKG